MDYEADINKLRLNFELKMNEMKIKYEQMRRLESESKIGLIKRDAEVDSLQEKKNFPQDSKKKENQNIQNYQSQLLQLQLQLLNYKFSQPSSNNINFNFFDNNNFLSPFNFNNREISLISKIAYFNHLIIYIKDKGNKNINEALIHFMNNFKKKIKNIYEKKKIQVNFKEEKDTSFKICYKIPPIEFDFTDIEFLDEIFESKVKYQQIFEIEVGLTEKYSNSKKYYLIFIGNEVDKEDFYEHLGILKNIAKSLLLH